MTLATQTQVRDALRRLGHYRVVRAQEQVENPDGHEEGYWVDDGLRGSHLLALGLRETWGRNIEGGARLNDAGTWVPEWDPARMDVGWLQISRRYHALSLEAMPGVAAGTWAPIVTGKNANDSGFVPRFTDSLRYTILEMRTAIRYAETHSVPASARIRFAIVAHNAGVGGAMKGYQDGNFDKYTAGGDYSAWVLDARKKVVVFLNNNPDWVY